MYPHRRVSFIVKNEFYKLPADTERHVLSISSHAPMIKQALKKHGTTEEHAIDAKKIVFLKDNFIYYSYS